MFESDQPRRALDDAGHVVRISRRHGNPAQRWAGKGLPGDRVVDDRYCFAGI